MGFGRLFLNREDATTQSFFKVGFLSRWRLRLVRGIGFGRFLLNHITNEVQERRRQRHRDTEEIFLSGLLGFWDSVGGVQCL